MTRNLCSNAIKPPFCPLSTPLALPTITLHAPARPSAAVLIFRFIHSLCPQDFASRTFFSLSLCCQFAPTSRAAAGGQSQVNHGLNSTAAKVCSSRGSPACLLAVPGALIVSSSLHGGLQVHKTRDPNGPCRSRHLAAGLIRRISAVCCRQWLTEVRYDQSCPLLALRPLNFAGRLVRYS